MTTTPVPALTPRGAALRHLAATGGLPGTSNEPGWPRLGDGWLHLDTDCPDATDAPPVPGEEVAAAFDAGLLLCGCAEAAAAGGAAAALLATAEATADLDRLLTALDGPARWDLTLARTTAARERIAQLLELAGALAAPGDLPAWAAARAAEGAARLDAAAPALREQLRADLPLGLAARARRGTAAAELPESDGQHLIAPVGLRRARLTAEQRAVVLTWPSVTSGPHFYARVPGWSVWTPTNGFIDCGPVTDADTDAVLLAALRLHAGVTEGPMTDPAEALRVARDLTAAGQL